MSATVNSFYQWVTSSIDFAFFQFQTQPQSLGVLLLNLQNFQDNLFWRKSAKDCFCSLKDHIMKRRLLWLFCGRSAISQQLLCCYHSVLYQAVLILTTYLFDFSFILKAKLNLLAWQQLKKILNFKVTNISVLESSLVRVFDVFPETKNMSHKNQTQ